MIEKELEKLERIGSVIIDPYMVVDAELNILDFNGAFRSLFPRQVSRRLKKIRCCDALSLDICASGCIARAAWSKGQNVRLDEITGVIPATGEEVRLIGSATPICDSAGKQIATLVIYRNVTDEAKVQAKYKTMLEEATRERQELEEELRGRTRELLDSNETINRLEQELMQHRKGLWESSALEIGPSPEAEERAVAPDAPRQESEQAEVATRDEVTADIVAQAGPACVSPADSGEIIIEEVNRTDLIRARSSAEREPPGPEAASDHPAKDPAAEAEAETEAEAEAVVQEDDQQGSVETSD